MTAIVVRGLRKSYGATHALRDISFEVEPGEVFGLLGPNGAGKTTAVEILEGFRRRDAGEVSVLGVDPEQGGRRLRERIGLVLQECAVPPLLTVTELIDLYRGYYPAPRATADIIELVGLEEKARARIKTLSGGQQRRLDVALSLVGDPELVFLDEPTTGFDPSARRQAWELVRSMRALGKTILLTTHYMDEAQQLADRICILRQGTVVAEGTPQSLRAATDGRTRVRFSLSADADVSTLALPLTLQDGVATLETATPTRTLNELSAWALARDLELPDIEVTRPSLEDVYLELTAHE
jgi:ABC-2 type transport system ATP-binding protein